MKEVGRHSGDHLSAVARGAQRRLCRAARASRLVGCDRPIDTQVNIAVQKNVKFEIADVAERLIQAFDHEPELKGRIAQALLEMDHVPRA
jgi:hypothetical protein